MKDQRVLITGADGFIGSHLTEMLTAQGAKVRALCQYNSFNFWGWLESSPVKEDVEILTGDIRDPFCMEKAVQNVDVVFHLAALISIPYSYKAPMSNVQTNIDGTMYLAEASLKAGVQRFIHTSTSEVYGTAVKVPIDESHPLQPQSPYSASKIGAEMMAMSYFNAFDLPVTVVRPFNTYGPRQSARAVIPTIISQLAMGKNEILLGSVEPTRDFNYVTDTCRGFLEIASCKEAVGETINIGSNQEISVGELAKKVVELMGLSAEVRQDPERIRPEKSEVDRLWCDNSKIKGLTGYTPAVSLEEGLKKTIEFFKVPENLKWYKSEYTL